MWDFGKFLQRLEIINKLTWDFTDSHWELLGRTRDLRMTMMRLFKRAQLLNKEEEVILKAIVEITTSYDEDGVESQEWRYR